MHTIMYYTNACARDTNFLALARGEKGGKLEKRVVRGTWQIQRCEGDVLLRCLCRV